MAARIVHLRQYSSQRGLETLSKHYKVSFAATDIDKQLSGEFYAEDLDLIISLIESALDVHIVKK